MAIGRRQFISALGGAAVTWPLAARAQQPSQVIGFLGSETPQLFADRLRAFRQGLNDTGYFEAKNVAIEYRWADGHNDRLPALAAELVRRQVNVIATPGSIAAALAAKTATATIPIVFQVGADPIAFGLVASLNRPGGNLTGVTSLNNEVGPKRLELLHQMLPAATSIALLINPTSPSASLQTQNMVSAARSLGLRSQVLNASSESDFDAAFGVLMQTRAEALVIATDPFFTARSQQLAELALRDAVPTIFQYREFAAAGGLMSYGGDITEVNHQAGVYTGRILHGEKPADLPVQQSTKVELIINLKTAKALGLTVPLSLLGLANEVIE